ncbi:replication factor A protein, partial [Trifolium medium]|nr:replication factor A protein [Trifolium medium]
MDIDNRIVVLKLIGKSPCVKPVVVVQFAKIKVFREKASIQNVMNATGILIDPKIEECVNFKNGLAINGIEVSSSIPILC